jgi:hypothetical protein
MGGFERFAQVPKSRGSRLVSLPLALEITSPVLDFIKLSPSAHGLKIDEHRQQSGIHARRPVEMMGPSLSRSDRLPSHDLMSREPA